MKRALLIAILCVAVPAAAGDLTAEDVVTMAESGVSPDILLDTVAKSGQTLSFTDAERKRLEKAGVPEDVIQKLGGHAASSSAREAAEAARAAEESRGQAEAARRAEEAEAERARLKGEASKLAAGGELKKQASADIDRLIDRAYVDLSEKDYAAAAALFDQVVSGGLLAPNTVRFVDASYGLALALTRAGLPSAAAPHLVEVLRHGPTAPRFDEALRLLAAYAATVDYTHPILELLDSADLSKEPEDVRDEHAFLVGAYRARFGDWDRARTRLQEVKGDGKRGPAAAYRLGLVEVGAGRPLEGLRAFELAVERAEKRKDTDVRDLAYLALARIAYEVGRYDAAADYYQRIGVRSLARPRARYELVWSKLLAGDDAGALAALEVAGSSRYANELVAPDLGVVEATVYLDLCRYDDARERADAFLAESTPLLAWLEQVVDQEPAAAYTAALAHPVGRVAVQTDLDTYVAAAAADAVAAELQRLDALAGDLGAETTKRVRAVLEERRRLLSDQAAAAALRRLRALRLEVADLSIQADEVKVEVDFAQREILQGSGEAGVGGAGGKARRPADDESYWKVDDERWIDEEDGVTSSLPSQCPQVVK